MEFVSSIAEPFRGSFARFVAATQELVESRELLRRVDSKFVLPTARLDSLLEALAGNYAVLRVPTGALATYESVYFDTPSLQCFHDHRRGRRPRHKIRIRHYPDRRVSFFEVKTRRNEVVTDKHRLAIPFGHEELAADQLAFLRTHVGGLADLLRPTLAIRYRRLSLISLADNERVTIDLDLGVQGSTEIARQLGHLAIVEVKQSRFCVRTPVMRALQRARVRQRALSKYVVALALLRPELARNRLLPALRALERMDRRG
jgi:hypothetical protein